MSFNTPRSCMPTKNRRPSSDTFDVKKGCASATPSLLPPTCQKARMCLTTRYIHNTAGDVYQFWPDSIAMHSVLVHLASLHFSPQERAPVL